MIEKRVEIEGRTVAEHHLVVRNMVIFRMIFFELFLSLSGPLFPNHS